MIKEENQVDHDKVLQDFVAKQKARIQRLKEKCNKKKPK